MHRNIRMLTDFRLKGFVVYVLLGIMGFVASACGSNESPAAPGTKQIKRIAIAYALGGRGDLSYNDAAYRGAESLKEREYSVYEYEPSNAADFEKGLVALLSHDPQVLFCIGPFYDDAAKRVASSDRAKNTRVIILDGDEPDDHTWTGKFDAKAGSALAGQVAALLTTTKKLGFVGGADIPAIREFLVGYVSGSSGITVESAFVGTGGAGFTDPVRGREVALTLLSGGVDVVFQAAGASGNGVIRAVAERKAIAIGVDVDQSSIAPTAVATSVLKNFDVAMLLLIDRWDKGQLNKPSKVILSLEDGAVSLAPFASFVPEAVRQQFTKYVRSPTTTKAR